MSGRSSRDSTREARSAIKGTTIVAAPVALTLLTWPGSAVAAPPTNDDFDHAILVGGSLPFADTVSSADATTATDDPQPCLSTALSTVWYRFTPTRSGMYAATGTAEPYGAFVSVYTGTRGALTPVVCGSNNGAGTAVAGTTYYLMVSAFPWSPPGADFRFHLDGSSVLDVTLDPRGRVDLNAGSARVSGTLTCRATGQPRIDGELQQRVGRTTISRGFGISVTTCDATPQRWVAQVGGGDGFTFGRASVWVHVHGCPDAATCLTDHAEGDVILLSRR
ncbi:hypothetical protein [Plantactinospora endophytica]|uniref:Ig-like domain-containing protein n=1 Tax=Plantactinospora endophytica TaxID=673535 RepID=A0ABQ4EEM9_9ACTN|nr:hypothetical protein [Plantactinospora endophytica]GIG93187.1 hypothetical protein Pen02_81230 [Plantactinospora endophytica]